MKTTRLISLALAVLFCFSLALGCGKNIGKAQAKNIALEDAGFTKADVTDLDCELDREGGVSAYEVSFDVGFDEYEYLIDATTGEILRSKLDD